MKIDNKKPQPIKVGVLGLVVQSPTELQLILSTDEEYNWPMGQELILCHLSGGNDMELRGFGNRTHMIFFMLKINNTVISHCL